MPFKRNTAVALVTSAVLALMALGCDIVPEVEPAHDLPDGGIACPCAHTSEVFSESSCASYPCDGY